MPTEEPLGLSDCSSGDEVTLGLGMFADVLAYNVINFQLHSTRLLPVSLLSLLNEPHAAGCLCIQPTT